MSRRRSRASRPPSHHPRPAKSRHPRRARVVLLLATLTAFAAAATLAASPAAALTAADFQPPGTCSLCHDTLFRGWVDSMHSKAFIDPVYQYKLQQGSKATKGKIDGYCLRCHIPIGFNTGEVPPVGSKRISSISRFGVQCDFCHTATGPVPKTAGFGAVVSKPGSTKRGPFGDAVSPVHGSLRSPLHSKSEFCGMCHDVKHPNGKFMVEATYSEWKASDYAKKGVQCQDCHMAPTVGAEPPWPGKACYFGPTRPSIKFMTFVGANTVFGPTDKAQAMLKRAAKVELSAGKTAAEPGDELRAEVAITNVGAGHSLPTGLTEIREMWIEVVGVDVTGKEYPATRLDEAGEPLEGVRMFSTILKDAEGRTEVVGEDGKPGHVELWDSVAIASDDRIPAGETATQAYAFTVPAEAVGPVKLTARLKYRSFSDEIGAKAGIAKVPVVTMAEDSEEIRLPQQGGYVLRVGIVQLGIAGLILAFLVALGWVLATGRARGKRRPDGGAGGAGGATA